MKELLFFVLGCVFVFFLTDMRNKCYLSSNSLSLLQNKIQILVRQASRWAAAAKQDENSMIAVLHANYGAGYLWALKDIATDTQVENATGIDIKKFTGAILTIQDNATQKMAKLCPKYAPSDSYLTRLSGLSPN
jgi:hypothetical protein